MEDDLWNEDGEAYLTRDGCLIPLRQAIREGRIVNKPFEIDGTGYIRNGKIYASKEDADKDI